MDTQDPAQLLTVESLALLLQCGFRPAVGRPDVLVGALCAQQQHVRGEVAFVPPPVVPACVDAGNAHPLAELPRGGGW